MHSATSRTRSRGGERDTILHWNGKAFVKSKRLPAGDVSAIAQHNSSVWVVGEKETKQDTSVPMVFHTSNGKKWTAIHVHGKASDLSSVSTANGKTAFASGTGAHAGGIDRTVVVKLTAHSGKVISSKF